MNSNQDLCHFRNNVFKRYVFIEWVFENSCQLKPWRNKMARNFLSPLAFSDLFCRGDCFNPNRSISQSNPFKKYFVFLLFSNINRKIRGRWKRVEKNISLFWSFYFYWKFLFLFLLKWLYWHWKNRNNCLNIPPHPHKKEKKMRRKFLSKFKCQVFYFFSQENIVKDWI